MRRASAGDEDRRCACRGTTHSILRPGLPRWLVRRWCVTRSDVFVERLTGPAPKVARLLEDAAEDLLAYYEFPAEHWPKLRSTNPLERVNKEIGRRSDVVGIFPDNAALLRLAGMLLIEQNDEWLVQRRYLSETSAQGCGLDGTYDPEQRSINRYISGGDRAQRCLSRGPLHDGLELHHTQRLDSTPRGTGARGGVPSGGWAAQTTSASMFRSTPFRAVPRGRPLPTPQRQALALRMPSGQPPRRVLVRCVRRCSSR